MLTTLNHNSHQEETKRSIASTNKSRRKEMKRRKKALEYQKGDTAKRIRLIQDKMFCNNNNTQTSQANQMSERGRRINRTSGKHVIGLLLEVILVVLTLSAATCSQGAVVRPTVFRDPTSSTSGSVANSQVAGAGSSALTNSGASVSGGAIDEASRSSLSSAAAASQSIIQVYQANNAIPMPSSSSSSSTSIQDGANNPSGQQQQQQQQQGTKITPIKSSFCFAPSGARLDAPLGLQSLQVDDFALSASSRSNELVGPQFARLNLDFSGGAWCPERPISSSNFGKEWIQVKLNRSYVVNAIETQGRYSQGNGKEFVPSYQIEYSRNGGLSWHKWKDFHGSSLLRGNEDVNSAVKNELSPPIVGANVIRILPYSAHLRTVCLRFELYGCLYDEGAPISYETNDGVIEPRWGHLVDYTYDGLKLPHLPSNLIHPSLSSVNHLSKGLGQLIDGVKGQDNFAFNSGFEWVGWKSMNGDVIIEFTFKTIRNFNGALFHSNNMFSNGVEVFQAVDVHYGIDVPLSMEAIKDSLWERERRFRNFRSNNHHQQQQHQLQNANDHTTLWSSEINNIEYEPDKKDENSRPVTVHLKNRFANKLRFVLKFASKWILISEVEFISQPVELLSLATCHDEQTPHLLAALQPAKSYDEYVAILREHQLRRTVTSAILRQNNIKTQMSDQQQDQLNPLQDPSLDQPMSMRQPSEIRIGGFNFQQPHQNPADIQATDSIAAPSINPTFQGNFIQAPYPPSIPLGSMNTNNLPDITSSTMSMVDQALLPEQSSSRQQASNDNLNSNILNKREQQQQQLGLATVISSVFVSILLFLGLVLAISSYRLRCKHPKLGTPRLPGQHLHLAGSTAHQLNSSKAGGLRGFMNVFANSSSATSSTSSAGSSSSSNNLRANSSALEYNALFAHSNSATNVITAGGCTLHKLPKFNQDYNNQTSKRLILMNQQQQQQQNPHFMTTSHHLQQQHHQGNATMGNQLLVSVKDSIGSQRSSMVTNNPVSNLFGFNSHTSAKPQSINTQLILGLNQANPMAQQQIYNNMNNIHNNINGGGGGGSSSNNYSNQTYSMSMASSSTTNGHQGDYGDYAIPDVPNTATIITPLVPQHPSSSTITLPATATGNNSISTNNNHRQQMNLQHNENSFRSHFNNNNNNNNNSMNSIDNNFTSG